MLGRDGPCIKLADIRGDTALAATWEQTAREVKADILEHGVDNRGVLCQYYGTDALDASTLLAAIFGFLPGSDERLRATVLAIADELTEDGFVLRYRTGETDDGMSGKEGTFVICSFWLVSALAIIGEMQRARDLMERLTKVASPLGCMPRSSTSALAGTSAISRRRSRTLRWSRPLRGSCWPSDSQRSPDA